MPGPVGHWLYSWRRGSGGLGFEALFSRGLCRGGNAEVLRNPLELVFEGETIPLRLGFDIDGGGNRLL